MPLAGFNRSKEVLLLETMSVVRHGNLRIRNIGHTQVFGGDKAAQQEG